MRILLCDDSVDELEKITGYFAATKIDGFESETGGFAVVCFDNPYNALEYYESGNHFDAAIFDIIMPGMSGLELAGRLRTQGYKGYIIFLTVDNGFATQSYGVDAFHYILKPVSEKAMKMLLEKLEQDWKNKDNDSFSLKIRSERRRVLYRELIYAEVISHNLYFHLTGGETIIVYAAMKEYADAILADGRMIRANKSFIINIDHIASFEKQAIVMVDGARISVTNKFADFKKICYRRMFGKDDIF